MVTSYETRTNQENQVEDSSTYYDAPNMTTRYNSPSYTSEDEDVQGTSESVVDAPQYESESEYKDNEGGLQEESEYTIVKTFMPNVEATTNFAPPVIEQKPKTTTKSVIKLNARGKIFACMYGLVATLLVAFCIYNAVSLANINKNLAIKNAELNSINNTVNELNVELNSTKKPSSSTIPEGYTKVSESNTVVTQIDKRPSYVQVEESSNWFDRMCEFFSNLFS